MRDRISTLMELLVLGDFKRLREKFVRETTDEIEDEPFKDLALIERTVRQKFIKMASMN